MARRREPRVGSDHWFDPDKAGEAYRSGMGVGATGRGGCEDGHELVKLHLGYETCKEYPLEVAFTQLGEPRPEHFRIGARAMRFADDEKTVLAVNEHVSLRGIPALAYTYQVNGRTPLAWFIDRYRIKQDRKSGIVNDSNACFDDSHELIAALRRIVHVSVETARIVTGLPEPFTTASDVP